MPNPLPMQHTDDLYYRFDYSFSSCPDDQAPDNLITEIKGRILLEDLEERTTPIGSFQIHQILTAEALEMEWPLSDVMDTDAQLKEIGKIIFDYDTDELKEEIHRHYEDNITNSDYFILTRMEIDEDKRKDKIGLLVLDDVLRRFSGSARLFVLKAFPLKYEGKVNADNEAAYLRATGQLVKYYAQLGFHQIPGLGELMFLNPAFKRDRIEIG